MIATQQKLGRLCSEQGTGTRFGKAARERLRSPRLIPALYWSTNICNNLDLIFWVGARYLDLNSWGLNSASQPFVRASRTFLMELRSMAQHLHLGAENQGSAARRLDTSPGPTIPRAHTGYPP